MLLTAAVPALVRLQVRLAGKLHRPDAGVMGYQPATKFFAAVVLVLWLAVTSSLSFFSFPSPMSPADQSPTL